MGEKTGIEWTDHTWNPWIGCEKVSPGCAHCYMFREMKRYHPNAPAGTAFDPGTVTRASRGTFRKPLNLHEPGKVFTCSWSDWFHEDADEWRPDAWEIVRNTQHLTYQILTKRPENIIDRLPDDWGKGYPNVWIGVSVENQKMAEVRIPLLLRIPAAVRFLSIEPLLGPVDLQPWFMEDADIHWIIIGAESGPKHRPTKEEWVDDLIILCDVYDIAVFVKQLYRGKKLVKEPMTKYGQRLAYPGDTPSTDQTTQRTLF